MHCRHDAREGENQLDSHLVNLIHGDKPETLDVIVNWFKCIRVIRLINHVRDCGCGVISYECPVNDGSSLDCCRFG